MQGKWIVFEGLDGAGTTTQTRCLVRRLKASLPAGISVFETSEPTRGPIGAVCRSALHSEFTLDPASLALLFTADRSDHLHRPEGVLNRLKRGEWVVMDRYLYSTLAYQDGLDRDWLLALNEKFPRPNLAVFLDTPVEICLERLSGRAGERDLFETQESLRRIAESYRWVLEIEQTRSEFLILDGTDSIDALSKKIWGRVKEWIPG
jgi:dTMP kinase